MKYFLILLLIGCTTQRRMDVSKPILTTVIRVHEKPDSTFKVYVRYSYMQWAGTLGNLPDSIKVGSKVLLYPIKSSGMIDSCSTLFKRV